MDISDVIELRKEIPFIVVRYLYESGLKNTAHKLEYESGLHFNKAYLFDLIRDGKWEEVEAVVSRFIKHHDCPSSLMIFWNIKQQQYLEALDDGDVVKAVSVLKNHISKIIPSENRETVVELTKLLLLDNFRENPEFSSYGDKAAMRANLIVELEKFIQINPVLQSKSYFPAIPKKRLFVLVNQSLNWQHTKCNPRMEKPIIRSLYFDHKCPIPPQLVVGTAQQNVAGPSTSRVAAAPGGDAPNPVQMTHRRESARENVPPPPPPPNPIIILDADDSDVDINQPYVSPQEPADLPKILVRTLHLVQVPMTMDFHPMNPTLLLVGTNGGRIIAWEVNSGEKLLSERFLPTDLAECSALFTARFNRDPILSITKVSWNAHGTFFGVGSSKHLVRLYSYNMERAEINRHLEIECHSGKVNDIGFAQPGDTLYLITCGEDKTVKVWNVTSGALLRTFRDHRLPVTLAMPYKDLIISACAHGNIKVYDYSQSRPVNDFRIAGQVCTAMICSADDRIITCWYDSEGNSHIYELSRQFNATVIAYEGLKQPSIDEVHIEVISDRFLVAGDDFTVKFWDIDDPLLLETNTLDGNLRACPRIKSNKEGTLLAVSGRQNSIFILANPEGQSLCPGVRRLS